MNDSFWSRTPEQREARLRHKLNNNNEMNPVMDAILTIILLCVTPLIGMFAMIHDKLMFKFLNKMYIYNVSWEVMIMHGDGNIVVYPSNDSTSCCFP